MKRIVGSGCRVPARRGDVVRASHRFAFAALVLAVTASVLAVGTGESTGPDRLSQPDQRESLATDPRVRIVPQDNVVGLNNTTSLGLVTFNPAANDRSVQIEIRVWVTDVAGVNLRVNDRKPKSKASDHRGWRIIRTLEPGEYRYESLVVLPNSKPGEYAVNTDIEFVKDARRTIRSDKAAVRVVRQPDSCAALANATANRLLGNGATCLGDAGQCVEDNPNKASAFIGVLSFLAGLLLSDRFWEAVKRDGGS